MVSIILISNRPARKNIHSTQPEVKLASGCLGDLLKCSPFYWIPPLRWVPGWLRMLVWIGLGIGFYLIAPDTFGKTVGSLAVLSTI